MVYSLIISTHFYKFLKKIETKQAIQILEFLPKIADDPYKAGKALTSNKKGTWSSRFGDYRVLYIIEDKEQKVYVTDLERRDKVYR